MQTGQWNTQRGGASLVPEPNSGRGGSGGIAKHLQVKTCTNLQAEEKKNTGLKTSEIYSDQHINCQLELLPPSEWQVSLASQWPCANMPPLTVNKVWTKRVAMLFSKTMVKCFGAEQIELWVQTHAVFWSCQSVSSPFPSASLLHPTDTSWINCLFFCFYVVCSLKKRTSLNICMLSCLQICPVLSNYRSVLLISCACLLCLSKWAELSLQVRGQFCGDDDVKGKISWKLIIVQWQSQRWCDHIIYCTALHGFWQSLLFNTPHPQFFWCQTWLQGAELKQKLWGCC